MNLMVAEMRRSLKELDLGLKGELTITSDMEALSDSLFFDLVSGEDSGRGRLCCWFWLSYFTGFVLSETLTKSLVHSHRQ